MGVIADCKNPSELALLARTRSGRGESEEKDSEEEEKEDCEEPYSFEWENNLAMHEDSLSIMSGSIDTALGKGLKIWITTDSGSMTQLVSKKFAQRMKLPTTKMKIDDRFCINGPGGGRDNVTEEVELSVKLKVKEEKVTDQTYEENEEEEETYTIKMNFGVCEDLPVPILWGGGQMRQHGLLDYHTQRVLSLKKPKGGRYVTQSTSWMGACADMETQGDARIKPALKHYLPSKDRMTNMVSGGRQTHNTQASLFPGKDNVVRIARHNARIDEGYNSITLVNATEIEEEFGGAITVIESVANGEAFIVVRNNRNQPIQLQPGKLKLQVSPAICLPSIHRESDLDFESSKQLMEDLGIKNKEQDELTEMEEVFRVNNVGATKELSDPSSFFSWNMNGLTQRVGKDELKERFYKQLEAASPDIVCLQEVKLRSMEGDPERIKENSEDEECWKQFYKPLKKEYKAYMSLAETRYGGQIVLVRRRFKEPTAYFNMEKKQGHIKGGRYINLEFDNLDVISLYAPFNGQGKPHQLERRQEWDKQLRKALAKNIKPEGSQLKPKFVVGDMNVTHTEMDISPHKYFWGKQGNQEVDEKDRGFGGSTTNERDRFTELMDCGGMVDTMQELRPGENKTKRYTWRGQGKFFGKGMRLDYGFVDWTISATEGVKTSSVLTDGHDRESFMGSDHIPILVELHPDWNKRRSNFIDYAADKCQNDIPIPDDEKEALQLMFRNTRATETIPKVRRVVAGHVKIADKANLHEDRPVEFPEDLWECVEPDQRGRVQERFSKFRTTEYLLECIDNVMNKLDIFETEEFYDPRWKGGTESMSEEKVMRAQAVANLDIYFFPDPEKVALAKDIVAEINTVDDRPFKCRSRKLSVVQQAFLQAKTNVMLRMKQLEHSNSHWCHGLVLVPYVERMNKFMAEHGDEAMGKMFLPEHELEVATFFRLCIDLRMLNSKTVPDRFPLPRIDDLLESIPRNCGRYSLSDITDAFFKCEVKEEDRHKTAFKTHDRQLQFAVLPQGFINSPSIFCRLIASTFEGMDRSKFSAYIDDVLNHTDDFEDHLETQQEMYNRLRNSQLTLKLSKTHLNYKVVKFLGHILTGEGRMPDPKSVEAILDWAEPTTTKEVRSFLGATLYYREYIYQYADMAMPLYELIRKGVIVEKEWDPVKHGDAVRKIKEALTSKPVLMQVDNTKPFRLKVDACRVGRGIGCILEQMNAQGKWQPVSYFSSSLSKEERQYSATELECKALHDCILHYAVYLKYIPHFEVFSDHNALRYMVHSDNATTNGRLMRYLLALQEFNFAIYYRRCLIEAAEKETRARS